MLGAHEIVPDLLAPPQVLTRKGTTVEERYERGHRCRPFHAAVTIGVLDVGQAAIAVGGRGRGARGYRGDGRGLLEADGIDAAIMAGWVAARAEHSSNAPSPARKNAARICRPSGREQSTVPMGRRPCRHRGRGAGAHPSSWTLAASFNVRMKTGPILSSDGRREGDDRWLTP